MAYMKVCKTCDETKPFEQFHKSSQTKDGHEGSCKSCKRDRQQARRKADPETVRAVEQRYRDTHRDTKRQSVRDWRAANPEAARRISRRSTLKTRYGITLERYDELLADQNGGCAVCGGVNANGQSLAVDHDHTCCPGRVSCGQCVRGLLCIGCNAGLGNFADSQQRLRAAADYLNRFSPSASR